MFVYNSDGWGGRIKWPPRNPEQSTGRSIDGLGVPRVESWGISFLRARLGNRMPFISLATTMHPPIFPDSQWIISKPLCSTNPHFRYVCILHSIISALRRGHRSCWMTDQLPSLMLVYRSAPLPTPRRKPHAKIWPRNPRKQDPCDLHCSLSLSISFGEYPNLTVLVYWSATMDQIDTHTSPMISNWIHDQEKIYSWPLDGIPPVMSLRCRCGEPQQPFKCLT